MEYKYILFSLLSVILAPRTVIVQPAVIVPPMADLGQREAIILEVPPILRQIALCESGDRHYNENGEVIRGFMNPMDIGRYQINLKYHSEQAIKMGLDLFNPVDNERFALHLYETQGTNPWKWSEKCWSKGR